MTDPKAIPAALVMGAIAKDALKPRRVKDLEDFFKRYPDARAKVEQMLGFGVAPDAVAMALSTLPLQGLGLQPEGEGMGVPEMGLPMGGVNEAGVPGPEQGPGPEQL